MQLSESNKKSLKIITLALIVLAVITVILKKCGGPDPSPKIELCPKYQNEIDSLIVSDRGDCSNFKQAKNIYLQKKDSCSDLKNAYNVAYFDSIIRLCP